ncbi:SH3 domain-containing protein [Desulfoplanes sp.]
MIRILLFLVLVPVPAMAQAGTPAANQERTFIQGIDAFNVGRFDQAADAFADLVHTGIRNGHLFYNLGNAYLKNGELGPAVYWYERALPFMPANADLRFNLDYARSLRIDDQPDTHCGLHRVLFFWEDLVSARTLQYLTMALNLLVWLGVSIGLVQSSRSIKMVTVTALLVLATLVPSAARQTLGPVLTPRGIVLPQTAIVRSGRTPSSTELFKLHAGTPVRVEERGRNWAKIRSNETMFGWIECKEIGIL